MANDHICTSPLAVESPLYRFFTRVVLRLFFRPCLNQQNRRASQKEACCYAKRRLFRSFCYGDLHCFFSSKFHVETYVSVLSHAFRRLVPKLMLKYNLTHAKEQRDGFSLSDAQYHGQECEGTMSTFPDPKNTAAF